MISFLTKFLQFNNAYLESIFIISKYDVETQKGVANRDEYRNGDMKLQFSGAEIETS